MALKPGRDIEGDPKAESKPKAENKPTVEDKPVVEKRARVRKIWLVIGATSLVIVGSLSFLAFTYFKGTGPFSAKKGKGAQTSKSEHVKAMLSLEPFLVKFADKEEIRFVKATFQLGLAEEPNEEDKNPVAIAAIRDSIISLLSSKAAEQILTPQGKDELRQEIRTRVKSVAPKIKILEVFIVDFVVQL